MTEEKKAQYSISSRLTGLVVTIMLVALAVVFFAVLFMYEGAIAKQGMQNIAGFITAAAVLVIITYVFAGVVIVSYIHRTVILPVREMVKLLEKATEEQENAQIPESMLERNDEVGQLSNIFSDMIQSIRKQTAEKDKLTESEFIYGALLDAADVPMSVIGTDGKLIYMNKAAALFAETSADQCKGAPCDCMSIPVCGSDDCGVAKLKRGDLTDSLFRHNGKWLRMKAHEMLNKDEKVIGYIEIIADITAEMHLEKFQETVDSYHVYISDISDKLTAMAYGDLDQQVTLDYKGNFVQVKNSLNIIIDELNAIMNEISLSAAQVSSASKSVAEASQSLAQATAEQVGASEQIDATIELLAAKAKENASNARKANDLVEMAKTTSAEGTYRMQEMIAAMTEISQASDNISKIIKTIEDIAFQTNILALNAAVEAARAGQYGRGFAVVASEVRNLASKSAKAAQDTTTLIETTVSKTGKGAAIARDTAQSFNKIVDMIQDASQVVNIISEATNEQAISIAQINTGIEHISSAAMVNSSTAEESASASEEMYTQAESLKRMIRKFKIRPYGEDLCEEPEEKNMQDLTASEPMITDADQDGDEHGKGQFEFKSGDYIRF